METTIAAPNSTDRQSARSLAKYAEGFGDMHGNVSLSTYEWVDSIAHTVRASEINLEIE